MLTVVVEETAICRSVPAGISEKGASPVETGGCVCPQVFSPYPLAPKATGESASSRTRARYTIPSFIRSVWESTGVSTIAPSADLRDGGVIKISPEEG